MVDTIFYWVSIIGLIIFGPFTFYLIGLYIYCMFRMVANKVYRDKFINKFPLLLLSFSVVAIATSYLDNFDV